MRQRTRSIAASGLGLSSKAHHDCTWSHSVFLSQPGRKALFWNHIKILLSFANTRANVPSESPMVSQPHSLTASFYNTCGTVPPRYIISSSPQAPIAMARTTCKERVSFGSPRVMPLYSTTKLRSWLVSDSLLVG